jgi:DNA-binding MarR family transcriptional regulator
VSGGPDPGGLLSDTALAVFRLHGRFLEESERMSRPAGLTTARWQVLGAVLREPLPVSGAARVMGITRQSAQRVADLLVAEGLAAYLPNPAHRRAKLLAPTNAGRAAVARIEPAHRDLALRLRERLGDEGFVRVRAALLELSAAMDDIGNA